MLLLTSRIASPRFCAASFFRLSTLLRLIPLIVLVVVQTLSRSVAARSTSSGSFVLTAAESAAILPM